MGAILSAAPFYCPASAKRNVILLFGQQILTGIKACLPTTKVRNKISNYFLNNLLVLHHQPYVIKIRETPTLMMAGSCFAMFLSCGFIG